MQEGRKVFKEVVPMAAAHIERHLHDAGLRADAGAPLLAAPGQPGHEPAHREAPGGPARSATTWRRIILSEYANTASAGSIIAFHEHHADLKAGDLGVICSFGAGYSIGSVVVRRI